MIVVMSGVAAGAVGFGSSASPLKVSGYGSSGSAYGNWNAAKSGTTLVATRDTTGYYKYTDADDHTVYLVLDTRAQGALFGQRTAYSSHDNVSQTASWNAFRALPSTTVSTGNNAGASVTAYHTLCLDVPLRADPCGAGLTTQANL